MSRFASVLWQLVPPSVGRVVGEEMEVGERLVRCEAEVKQHRASNKSSRLNDFRVRDDCLFRRRPSSRHHRVLVSQAHLLTSSTTYTIILFISAQSDSAFKITISPGNIHKNECVQVLLVPTAPCSYFTGKIQACC